MPIKGRYNESATRVNLKDPFMELIRANNNITNNKQLDATRNMKMDQFGQTMDLNRDKFAEQRAMNAFNQNMENRRLGLQQQRLALAQKNKGKALTPWQKKLLDIQYQKALLDAGLKRDWRKPIPGSNSGGSSKGSSLNSVVSPILNVLQEPEDKAAVVQDAAKQLGAGYPANKVQANIMGKVDTDVPAWQLWNPEVMYNP